MKTAFLVLFGIWSYFWAVFWSMVLGAFYLAGAPFDRNAVWMDLSQRLFSRSLLLSTGCRVKVEGAANIPLGSACVLMADHKSYLDIPALMVALKGMSLRFVAKRELTRIPFLGWALAVSHHVKVDRRNRDQAVTAINQASERIDRGIALVIFPEGTRSPDDRLLPFKKGGFYVAADTGYPILPVTIRNSGKLFGKRAILPRPGWITVIVHPPIPCAGRTRADLPGLSAATRAAILSALPEAVPYERPSPAPGGAS